MSAANYLSILKGRAIRCAARWALRLRNWRPFAAVVMVRLKALAPYALIELILPGGSVMACCCGFIGGGKMRLDLAGFRWDYWQPSDRPNP